MKLKMMTTAALALAAAAVFTTSAGAQVTTIYSSGDLLLGFEQSGNASNYLYDLGQVSQFINATGNLQFNLSTADLSTVFGSTWASNSQANLVQWGVVGNDRAAADQSSTRAVWYTQAEATIGTHPFAPVGASNNVQNQVSLNINALEVGSGGYQGGTSTANSTAGIVQSSSAANSWSSFTPSNGSGFNLGTGVEQPLSGSATGPTNSVLDLFQVTPNSTGKLLGEFSLGNNGVLTFASETQSVPEPSSYALMLAGLGLLLVLRRRSYLASNI